METREEFIIDKVFLDSIISIKEMDTFLLNTTRSCSNEYECYFYCFDYQKRDQTQGG